MTAAVALRGVAKHFAPRASVFGGGETVRAVDGVSFEVAPGRVLGIVGESGSGKSTLANLLVGLERPSAGEVAIEGETMAPRRDRALRRTVQMVFQDPFGSVNPRFTIGRTVAEPLLIHGLGSAEERRAGALAALEEAELRPGEDYFDRYPHELSGGQRQRVAIARAIVLRPKVLVADEPVSMLDVSIRAGILRLLKRLVAQHRMALVFITHDLSLVGQICDELAVMYRGRIVERGPALEVLRRPVHPYTRALIAAVPIPDPAVPVPILPAKLVAASGTIYRGEGCRFSPRCVVAVPSCLECDPVLAPARPDHEAACLRAGEIVAGRLEGELG